MISSIPSRRPPPSRAWPVAALLALSVASAQAQVSAAGARTTAPARDRSPFASATETFLRRIDALRKAAAETVKLAAVGATRPAERGKAPFHEPRNAAELAAGPRGQAGSPSSGIAVNGGHDDERRREAFSRAGKSWLERFSARQQRVRQSSVLYPRQGGSPIQTLRPVGQEYRSIFADLREESWEGKPRASPATGQDRPPEAASGAFTSRADFRGHLESWMSNWAQRRLEKSGAIALWLDRGSSGGADAVAGAVRAPARQWRVGEVATVGQFSRPLADVFSYATRASLVQAAQLARADRAMDRDDYDWAIALYAAAANHAPTPRDSSRIVDILCDRCDAKFADQPLEVGMATYRAFLASLASRPASERAQIRIVQKYFNDNQFEKCMAEIQLITDSPHSQRTAVSLGIIKALCLVRLDREEQARQWLDEMQKLPGSEEHIGRILFLKGWIYLQNHEVDKAKEILRFLVMNYPDDPYAQKASKLLGRLASSE